MSNVPKLRFKEFSGEWEEKKLGDIGKVTMCKRIMKDQTLPLGAIPFYKIGTFGKEADAYIPQELYENFKKKYPYPQKGDILIAASGATYGKTVVFDGSDSYFQDSNIVWIANNEKLVTNNFLNFIYRRVNWTIEESTIPRLYNGTISSTFLNVPTLKEQEKIASFLTSVDTKIEQLTKKETLLQEYKKGVMSKIFNQEIRFKDDDGSDFPEWEENTLGEVAKFRRGSFPQPYGLPEWYDDENGMPFIQVYDVDDNMKLKPKTKNKISKLAQPLSVFVEKGTIILTIQGSIGRIAITQYDAFVDRTLLIFTEYKKTIDKFFFIYLVFLLFEIEKMKAPGGTIKTITKEVLTEFKIQLPCIQEQTKIANFLSSIDKKIELTTKELNSTKEFKKALLQQMFV